MTRVLLGLLTALISCRSDTDPLIEDYCELLDRCDAGFRPREQCTEDESSYREDAPKHCVTLRNDMLECIAELNCVQYDEFLNEDDAPCVAEWRFWFRDCAAIEE